MSVRMNHDQKEVAVEFVRAQGTLKAGANAAGVTYRTLRNEMNRSPIFARRIEEARRDGVIEIGDKAIENIKRLASEEHNKDVRSRLTANLALANFAVPGFRGESKVAAQVNHNIRVVSAVPRPVYKDVKLPPKVEAISQGNEADYITPLLAERSESMEGVNADTE